MRIIRLSASLTLMSIDIYDFASKERKTCIYFTCSVRIPEFFFTMNYDIFLNLINIINIT